MKHFSLRPCIARLAGLIKSRSKVRPITSAVEEMHRGSLVGLLVCGLPPVFGGQPAILPWMALLGATGGAVIGLVLWLGSDNLNEPPIIPPPGDQP